MVELAQLRTFFLRSIGLVAGFSTSLIMAMLPWRVGWKFLDLLGRIGKMVIPIYTDFLLEPEFRVTRKTGKVDMLTSRGKDEIAVLFSGGSDSTLAALVCKHFKKVHLLTFHHSGMLDFEKASVNARKLQKKFGEEKFVHKYISIEELYKKLYRDSYLSDLNKYKCYIVACSCYACQLAMHIKTIIYALENNVGIACAGYKQEKAPVWFFMSEKGIKEIESLYEEYGLRLLNPVYHIVRTDWALFDLGITSKRDVKFPYEKIDFSAQHSCRNGILVNAYIQGYYIPLLGRKANESIATQYFREKTKIAKNYIQDCLRTRI